MVRRLSPSRTVFLIALAVRVVYCVLAVLVFHKPPPGGPRHDGYLEIARSLASGEGYRLAGEPNYFRPPAYVVFLLPWVLGPWTTWGILLAQSLVGAASCGLVTRILLRLTENRNALIGGLALALCPWHVHFTANAMTPVLATFLTLTLIELSVQLKRRRKLGWSGLAGVNFGALALCHPSAVLLGPAWMAWRISLDGRSKALRAAILSCLVFATCAAGTFSPWIIRNWRMTGAFIPLSNSAGFQAFVSDWMVRETPTLFSLPPQGIQPGMQRAAEFLKDHGIEPNAAVLSFKGVGMAEARVFDGWMREQLVSDGRHLGRRVFLQAWWFWFGDSPGTTIFHLIYKGGLLILALRAMMLGAWRNSIWILCAMIIVCYWSIHAVFMGYIPLAAYSLVTLGPLCIMAFSTQARNEWSRNTGRATSNRSVTPAGR